MFNSPILDLAITLSFTYFLLGLIVSSIHESILSIRKSRNKMLKFALEHLFFDKVWTGIDPKTKEVSNGLASKLLDSPFIKSLKKDDKPNTFPAYIPSKNFALALIDILKNEETGQLTTARIRELLVKDSVITGDAKKVMLGLLDEAGADMDRFISGLQRFFDDAMDRVVGWYKSKYNILLFLFSMGVAGILNVDTIHIVSVLWSDQDKLANMTESISEDFKTSSGTQDGSYVFKDGSGDTLAVFAISSSTQIDSTKKLDPISISRSVDVKLKSAGIPIGWSKNNRPSLSGDMDCWGWLVKFVGLLLTAAAIYLGAPFWFDLLNKFVNIRGVGKKPATQPVSDLKKENQS